MPSRQGFSELIKDLNFDKLKLELSRPNIFSILQSPHRELKHSNFLGWLLDPAKGHGLSDIFLKRFLRDIFSDPKTSWIDQFEIDALDLSEVRIFREWKNVDILIEAPEFVVGIENKINAQEGPGQIKKYRELLEKEFPQKKRAFVFLTLQGQQPDLDEDVQNSISYSYEAIKMNLGAILEIYGDAISVNARVYLTDYLLALERWIMKEGNLVDLARKIYASHKDALDYIYENKSDRLYEVTEWVEDEVRKAGYVLGSVNKGLVRFLTKDLATVIPNTGVGWKKGEAFLFELAFWPKQIKFQTVVSPGDENNRKVLSAALKKLEGSTTPRGKQWFVHYKTSKKMDVTAEEYLEEHVREAFGKILHEQEPIIKKTEKLLLEVFANK